MAFFKKYNGTQNVKLVRLERSIWVFIYGGLLTFILGHFVSKTDEDLARLMGIAGLAAVVVGAVLIYVRSRLRADDET